MLITDDLSWSDHINSICTKARKQLGFIYRKFYGHAIPNTLKTLYIAFVRLHLEYAIPVWNPHLKKDILALESVQRLATKICTKAGHGITYEDRLEQLNFTTLESRRRSLNLCYLFKLMNGLTHFPNFPLHATTTSYKTRSHSQTLYIPFARTRNVHVTTSIRMKHYRPKLSANLL